MATAYGRDTPQNQYVSPLDVNFITKSLLTMQDKYDKNKAALDKTMSQITSIQIDHKPTQEHFQNNLKKVMQGLQGENGNIAFGADMTQVENYIQTAIDDAVIAGYQGTVAKQRIQQQAAKFREEGKGLYSDANLAYSMKDFEDWQNDPRVGAYYKGNTNYVPYTDTSKIEKDLMKNLKPNESVSVRKDGVYIISESGERLADTHIQQMVEKEMKSNPNYSKQIEINSWVGYKDRSFEDVYDTGIKTLSSLRKEYARKAQEYNAIELIEKMGKDGKKVTGVKMDYPDDASRNMYMQKQSEFAINKVNEIDDFLKQLQGVDVNNLTDKQKKQYKEMIGGTLGKETYSFSVGKSFAFDNIKKKDMKADSFEVAKFQENNRNWRFGEEMKLKREEMAFDQQIDAKTLELAALKLVKDEVISADQALSYVSNPNAVKFLDVTTDGKSKTEEEVIAEVSVLKTASATEANKAMIEIINTDNNLDSDQKQGLIEALSNKNYQDKLLREYVTKIKKGDVGRDVKQETVKKYIDNYNVYEAAKKTQNEVNQEKKKYDEQNFDFQNLLNKRISERTPKDLENLKRLFSEEELKEFDSYKKMNLNSSQLALWTRPLFDKARERYLKKNLSPTTILEKANANGLAINTNQTEIDLTNNKGLMKALKDSGDFGEEFRSVDNETFQKYLNGTFTEAENEAGKKQLIPKIKLNPITGKLTVQDKEVLLSQYAPGSAIAQTVNTFVYQNQEKQKEYRKAVLKLGPLLSKAAQDDMAYESFPSTGSTYNVVKDNYGQIYLDAIVDGKSQRNPLGVTMPKVGNSEDFLNVYNKINESIQEHQNELKK